MRRKRAKSIENLRRLSKNGEVEKIEFLRKIRPYSRGCKASFYRKTTWQAFIFHRKKSFNQHASKIGEGRCDCLVSWRGMIQLHWTKKGYLCFNVGNGSRYETKRTDVYTKALKIVAFWPKHEEF